MILPPPIPSPISFQTIILDPTNNHNLDLSQTNSFRAKFRTNLKSTRKVSNSNNNGNNIDWVTAEQVS